RNPQSRIDGWRAGQLAEGRPWSDAADAGHRGSIRGQGHLQPGGERTGRRGLPQRSDGAVSGKFDAGRGGLQRGQRARLQVERRTAERGNGALRRLRHQQILRTRRAGGSPWEERAERRSGWFGTVGGLARAGFEPWVVQRPGMDWRFGSLREFRRGGRRSMKRVSLSKDAWVNACAGA